MIQFFRPLRSLTVVTLVVALLGMRLMCAHFGRVPILLLVAGLATYAMYYLVRRLQPVYRGQAIAAAIVVGFYACSAVTSVKPEELTSVSDASNPTGFYQGLTESFLRFELTLPVKPDNCLLKIANPYAPGRNCPYVWDASYYRSKYYIYFGITPVMTLFLPFRIITQHSLPTQFGLLTFLVGGFIGSVFVLERARMKCGLARPSTTIQVLSVLVLGFASLSPIVLRRPSVYEVAIASAYCFSMWGLYWLVRHLERPGPGRALLASLFFGLAVGSRPTFGVTVGLLLTAFAMQARSRWKAEKWATISHGVPLFAPFGTIIVLLGIYNKLRFGSWTEFGLHYQLDHLDMYNTKLSGINMVRGIVYYLFSTPTYSTHFPGINAGQPSHPFGVALHAGIHEDVLGLFGAIPVSCFLILAPVAVWRSKSRRLLAFAVFLIGFAGLMMLAVSNVGVSARYELDFVPAVLLASLLVFYGACDRRVPLLKALLEISWVPAACFSIIVGILASISDFQGASLKTYHASTFQILRHILWPEGKQFDAK